MIKLIQNHNTCKDLCNDNRYFLRRLQIYNRYLFKYDNRGKKGQYSKGCQRISQPVILNNDPRKKFNKKSFKDVLEYKVNDATNYYICPDAWCPKCNKPFRQEDLKNIENKQGINGVCTVALCPDSTKEDQHELFVRRYSGVYRSFPGFSTKIKHPNGHCLPCCFKNNQNNQKSSRYSYYKECIGENIVNIQNTDDKVYILNYKIPLNTGRYGLLPNSLHRIFGKCETGYLINKKCYIKKGIVNDINKSFLYCIADLISPEKKSIISIKSIIKNIVNNKYLDEKLFKSLNNGIFEFKFKTSKGSGLENYKKFLLYNKQINYEYTWDLLQRPGILFKNGCNIIIIEEFNIKCPYKEDINIFYDIKKPTLLIYTNNIYYEPIYILEEINKNKIINCIFPSDNKVISNIFEKLFNNCKYKYDIDWHRILSETENLYSIKLRNVNYENDKTLNEINQLLIKSKKTEFQLKYQILDNYNKVTGIVLENDLYIPVKASRLLMKYNYLTINKEYIKLGYKESIKQFKKVNKIINICNIKKINKIINSNKQVIGIALNSGRTILVKPSPNISDRISIIDISFYTNSNHFIEKNNKLNDNRIKYMVKYNYENEAYILFKLDFSTYINKNIELKDSIIEILNKNENDKFKRIKLKKILNDYIDKNIIIVDSIPNLNKYKIQNKRLLCSVNNQLKNNKKILINEYHCKIVNNKYKFIILKKNSINNKNNKILYVSQIVEELLRYEIKKQEILNNTIPLIINKSKIKFGDNLWLFINNSNNPNKFNKMVNEYFNDKDLIEVRKNKTFNDYEIKHIDINIDKYRIYKKDIDWKLLKIDLPLLWKNLLSNNYYIINYYNNSVFYIIQFILNKIKTINKKLEVNTIKKQLNDYISDSNKYLNNFFNNKLSTFDLYKKYGSIIFNKIKIIDQLKDIVNDINYNGTLIDLILFAKIYKLNIIIIRNRINKKFKLSYKIKNNNTNNFIIILLTSKYNKFNFNIIYLKNKNEPIFEYELNKLPEEFINTINKNINKKTLKK